jgi:hypothetical protein
MNSTENQHGKMNYKEAELNTFTLKINSKDRNLLREPNPFDFEVSFNQDETKDKAVISSKFENIKKIQLCEILMPRYIPRDYIGEPFNGITVLYNTPNSVTLSTYPGININNSVISMADDSNVQVLELVDLSLRRVFIVADQYNNPYKLSKLINLRAELYSYLNINDNIYPITSINGNIIYLDNTDAFPLPINTNNRLILGDFFKNTTIVDTTGLIISIIGNSINIKQANILNYQYIFKDQYLEYQINSNDSTIIEKKLFKVSKIITQLINNSLQPTIENTNVTILGMWTNGIPSEYKENNIIKINQFNYGVRDLLDEKIFYINLYPFVPSRNISTDIDVNKSFGIFFPSTQSKDYLFLKGEALETYTNSDLQSLSNKLKFNLLDSNYEQIGTIYNKFFNLYQPNNYMSYFQKSLVTPIKNTQIVKINDIDNLYKNTFSIKSYLPYFPDLTIIIKLELFNRKINF